MALPELLTTISTPLSDNVVKAVVFSAVYTSYVPAVTPVQVTVAPDLVAFAYVYLAVPL